MRYKSERLNKSRSAAIVAILLTCVEAYHTIDNDLGLIYARKEFQKFYRLLHNIVFTHRLILNVKLRRKLLFTAWVLVIINVLYAILQMIFLFPIVYEEVHEQSDPQDIYIKLPKYWALYITLIIKAFGSIHSKALDTLIIYFSLLVSYYIITFGEIVKELCDDVESPDYTINHHKNNRSFDDLKQAFLSIQKLIVEANLCLSPCIMLTIGCNIVAVMGGIFVGIDIFGQRAKLEEEEAFDLVSYI
jgi:hypothetical protein